MIARYATSVLGLVVVTAAVLRFTLVSPYLMSGSAMEPTLLPGEYLLATRGGASSLARNDVAVLKCPLPEPHVCIKRVIALEGDRIDFTDGMVHVNGEARNELIVAGVRESLVVPPESLFLVNDSPADGEDSRVWGAVETRTLEGRVRLIWLSLDWFNAEGEVRDLPRVRWSRMFSRVR